MRVIEIVKIYLQGAIVDVAENKIPAQIASAEDEVSVAATVASEVRVRMTGCIAETIIEARPAGLLVEEYGIDRGDSSKRLPIRKAYWKWERGEMPARKRLQRNAEACASKKPKLKAGVASRQNLRQATTYGTEHHER